jgi:quinol monooxygenase YgiN
MKSKVLILLISIAMIYSSCGNQKTAEVAKPADSLATKTPDYKMMIVAHVHVKADKAKDFAEAAKEMIENSNKEAGCRFYQLFESPYDNTKFVFVEEYDNQAAVDAHFASDYFKGFGPKITDMLAEPNQIKIISVAKEVVQ